MPRDLMPTSQQSLSATYPGTPGDGAFPESIAQQLRSWTGNTDLSVLFVCTLSLPPNPLSVHACERVYLLYSSNLITLERHTPASFGSMVLLCRSPAD